MVQSPVTLLSPHSIVQSLMDANLSQWNQALLNHIIFSDEEAVIIQLPISHDDAPNHLIWLHSKDGYHSLIGLLVRIILSETITW